MPTYFCICHQLLFTKIWYRETHSSDEYCIIFSLSSTRAHGKENYAPSIATWVLRESTLNLCHFKHTSGSAARPVLVSRASRSALASYRKVTTCRYSLLVLCMPGVCYICRQFVSAVAGRPCVAATGLGA